jgi:hypothetical protein
MMCWNISEDVESGQFKSHKLDETTRLVINVGYEEAHDEHYCKNCGMVYSWTSGRKASPDEIQQAKDGKLPQKQTNPALIARVN